MSEQSAISAPDQVQLALAPAVAEALEAARYAMSIVVDSPGSREDAARAMLALAKGERALRAAAKPVLDALKAIRSRVETTVSPASKELADATAYLTNQVKAQVLREQAEASREQARERERQAAIAKENERREAEGLPAPPPATTRYVPPATTNTKVEGGRVTMSRTLKVEIALPYELPEHLIALAPGTLAWVRDKIRSGELLVPRDGAPVAFAGMKVWYEPTLSKVVE